MKKFLFVIATLGLFVVCFSACHKGETLIPQGINASAFYEANGSNLQRFTGDASAGFVITGARGAEIVFPANAFVDGDGNVISGEVQVGIIEIQNRKDLLLSGVPTESNGHLLESGGEIYIEVIQNGDTLQLNPDNQRWSTNPVKVKLPRDTDIDPSGMILFDHGPRYDADVLADDSFTWLVFDESPQAMVQAYSYDFTIPTFGWINVDKFLFYPPDQLTFAHVKLAPGSTVGLQDVAVMMVFENINAVISLNYIPALQWFGTDSFASSPNLPIGEQVAVVAIARDAQDNLYFAKQENITLAADGLYTLTPQPATPEDVAWLNAL